MIFAEFFTDGLNTTWFGAIIGLAIIRLLVYAFRKGRIKLGKSGFKYGYKK